MEKKPKLCWIPAAYLTLFVLLCIRLFLSVELTDEVHGVASIYNIYLGKKPFMTSWDYHTGWCLLAPLFALFQHFSPEYEGVILFFRIAYLTFTVLCAGLISWLFYKKERNWKEAYFILPMICFVPFSIFQISYNTVLSYFLSIIAALLVTSEVGKRERLRYFGMGVLMGLGCITYPTLIITALFLIIWILFCNRHGQWRDKIAYYILGGGLCAAFFCIYIFSDGNIILFFKALQGMFSSPHEVSKGDLDQSFLLKTFYTPLKTFLKSRFGVIVACYLGIQIGLELFKWKKKELYGNILLTLFLMSNAWLNRSNSGYGALGIGIAAACLYFFRLSWHKKYASLFVLLIACIMTYSFTSDNRNMLYGFSVAGPLICLLTGLCIWELAKQKGFYFATFCMVLLGATGILQAYSYVYRDEPAVKLTQRVESGIYKGLYTTKERKQMVEQLEPEVVALVEPNETVCAVTRAPMLYLMAKADICAPQTWDAQFLARGYTSAEPLLSYFSAVGELPDILFATDMDIPDFIHQEQYEIQEFIKEYYDMYYENQIEGVTIWTWKRKN